MSRAALVTLAADGTGVDPDDTEADMTGPRTSAADAATAKRRVDVMDELLGVVHIAPPSDSVASHPTTLSLARQ